MICLYVRYLVYQLFLPLVILAETSCPQTETQQDTFTVSLHECRIVQEVPAVAAILVLLSSLEK